MGSMRSGLVVAAILASLIAFPGRSLALEADAQRLIDAAKNGELAAIQTLLDKGVAIGTKDDSGRTPLHWAAANGHQATSEILLKAGADINAKDNAGETPLDLATNAHHDGLAAFLGGKGGTRSNAPTAPPPNPDASSDVPTASALLEAAKTGDGSKVQSLLEKGIPVNAKDENGLTPLHLAAANGHQAAAETLLKAGADINATDNAGQTPLDHAASGGHEGLATFLTSKGGTHGKATGGLTSSTPGTRTFSSALPFKTLAEFEKESKEPCVILDSENVSLFAPKRREKEARIVFEYLVKAYDAYYEIVGAKPEFKIAVYVFPRGNPNGWGGTHTQRCSIDYNESTLDLAAQPEWTKFKVPHVSGFIEEMGHNFVHATKAQFGWEMVGWSISAIVSRQVADNPILAESIRSTREGQKRTFEQYMKDGCVFPANLPANQCDRIHAWVLYQCASKYGPRFWNDFFREVRSRKQALTDAVKLAGDDAIRNARYQITIDCFDRLPGTDFKKRLKEAGISLTTDVGSLRPESPG